jgi:hypothetical protein
MENNVLGIIILSVVIFCIMVLVSRWVFRIDTIVKTLEEILEATKKKQNVSLTLKQKEKPDVVLKT